MNTYNITATREDGTTFADRVTAATPGEARKDFKDIYRHGKPYTITDTELLADDVPATKDQERKALEQIKAILATLGPNSYVAAALDGCLEDAERNIEDDAAYSMKSRLESADLEIVALKDKLAEAEKKIQKAQLDERDLREAIKRVKNEDSIIITTLQQRALSPDDLEDCRQLVAERAEEQEAKAKQAAAEIVAHAEDPTGPDFTEAVRLHRAYTHAAEYTRDLESRIRVAMEPRA